MYTNLPLYIKTPGTKTFRLAETSEETQVRDMTGFLYKYIAASNIPMGQDAEVFWKGPAEELIPATFPHHCAGFFVPQTPPHVRSIQVTQNLALFWVTGVALPLFLRRKPTVTI